MREPRSWRCLFLYPSTGLTLTGLLEGIEHNLSPLVSRLLRSLLVSFEITSCTSSAESTYKDLLSPLSFSVIFVSLSRDTFTTNVRRSFSPCLGGWVNRAFKHSWPRNRERTSRVIKKNIFSRALSKGTTSCTVVFSTNLRVLSALLHGSAVEAFDLRFLWQRSTCMMMYSHRRISPRTPKNPDISSIRRRSII
jgi:hypothetical protein